MDLDHTSIWSKPPMRGDWVVALLHRRSSMNSSMNPARSRLRATLVTIQLEITRLQERLTDGQGKSPLTTLAASMTDLVDQLALGSEPDVRECPACKQIGMRAATLCGYCWTKLTPPSGQGAAVA
jgi:hypothetical protein